MRSLRHGGACACPSTSAPNFCSAVGCVNFSGDAQNCGKCGNACPSGQVCSAGACGCPSGQTLCGQQCVDTQTDTNNCGACGSACGPVQACSGGSCGCESFGLTVCAVSCSNLHTDV